MIREPEDKSVYLFGEKYSTTASGLAEFGLQDDQSVSVKTADMIEDWNASGDIACDYIKKIMSRSRGINV